MISAIRRAQDTLLPQHCCVNVTLYRVSQAVAASKVSYLTTLEFITAFSVDFKVRNLYRGALLLKRNNLYLHGLIATIIPKSKYRGAGLVSHRETTLYRGITDAVRLCAVRCAE